MDLQQECQLLTFSYPPQIRDFSPLPIDLDTLQNWHPGIKEFLLSNILTHDILVIHPIKVSQSGKNVYVLENTSGVKLILKVLPTKHNNIDDMSTEKALTKVTSELFVSPECIHFHRNFILLHYIGGVTSHCLDAAPFLSSEQSFVRVLKRLSLLHGANIIPHKVATTHFNTLNLLKSKSLNTRHIISDLEVFIEKINAAYSVSMAASSATNSVFIHANLTPLHIVENSRDLYLIDWQQAGKGNPYFDLGAVFAMYALKDERKLKLIREHYPNTIYNTLPEEDSILLKELNLFAAIYWCNVALSVMNANGINPRQSLFLKGCQRNHSNIFSQQGVKELIDCVLSEALLRMNMIEQLSHGIKFSF